MLTCDYPQFLYITFLIFGPLCDRPIPSDLRLKNASSLMQIVDLVLVKPFDKALSKFQQEEGEVIMLALFCKFEIIAVNDFNVIYDQLFPYVDCCCYINNQHFTVFHVKMPRRLDNMCPICGFQAGGKDLLKRSWKNLADHISIEVRVNIEVSHRFKLSMNM